MAKLPHVLLLLAAAGIACGNNDSTGVDDENGIQGLSISASVTVIAGGGSVPTGAILAVGVAITNTTGSARQLSYPAGCPVRVRLYRPGSTSLVYDQTTFPCDDASTVALTIPAGETKNLTSGTTFPWVIESNEVPAAIYSAVAVVRITGQNPVEVQAGQYRLPHCATPTTCAYVGPPATIDPSRIQ